MSEADQIRKAKLLNKYSAMKTSTAATTASPGPAAAGAGSARMSKYASMRASTSPLPTSSIPMATDEDTSSASGTSSNDNSPGSTTLGLGLSSGGSGISTKPAVKGPGLLRRPQKKPEEMGPPDTLLVEDVPVSRKIAEVAFKRAKYSVISVGSGEEAVDLFKKHKDTIKLVLMDIGLGQEKMNGVDATKQIRAFEAEFKMEPIIILGLTGNFQEEDLAKYKEAKMNGCIAKGELLQKSVNQATTMLKENPEQFVVLAAVPTSAVHSPIITPSQLNLASGSSQAMLED